MRFFIDIILGLVAEFAFMVPSTRTVLSSSAARWKRRKQIGGLKCRPGCSTRRHAKRLSPTSVGLWLELVIIMTDTAAESARLMNVIDAMLAELDRQGLTEVMANLGFDCTALAKAVIDAADGDVVQFPGGTRGR